MSDGKPRRGERYWVPWPVRTFNAAGRKKTALGFDGGTRLDVDELLTTARRHTGLDDFAASDTIYEGLATLVDDYRNDETLTPFGRNMLRKVLLRNLSSRLRIVDRLYAEPEITRQQISRPLFVIGLPRTGTTLLFNLLAQDPAARPLMGWEAAFPLEPGSRLVPKEQPRKLVYRALVKSIDYFQPTFQQIHFVDPTGPEECIPLLNRTFVSWAYTFWNAPGYAEWLWNELGSETYLEAYRFYRSQLQLLQSARRGGYWLLKSPAHIYSIESLLEVLPDAAIVQTHRDLKKVAPSAVSLFAVGRDLLYDDTVAETDLGRMWVGNAERLLDHLIAVRNRLPADRIVDVQYEDLVQHPVETVRRIHDHFGYATSPEMEAGMTNHLSANPKHKRGLHEYSLEQFGIDEAELDDAAQSYHERFLVPSEL